jgi:pSer/pThr/pTyr-binding forkhead associated (FHA) protein
MARHYFIIEQGIVREKLLPVQAVVAIGRDPENDIQLSDRFVSRRHAIVRLVNGERVLEDLGSQNGTFINEKRVEKAVLRSGDTLRLGYTILRFIHKAERRGATPEPRSPSFSHKKASPCDSKEEGHAGKNPGRG